MPATLEPFQRTVQASEAAELSRDLKKAKFKESEGLEK